jgi:hypothetical protein
MTAHQKKILISACVLTLALPLYAQEAGNPPKNHSTDIEAQVALPDQPDDMENSFWEFVDKKAYAATVDEKEEKKILREEWKKLLGVDIFYPYFKAKEVEGWVSDKASLEFFKIRGRPKFENNQIKYIFKVRF